MGIRAEGWQINTCICILLVIYIIQDPVPLFSLFLSLTDVSKPILCHQYYPTCTSIVKFFILGGCSALPPPFWLCQPNCLSFFYYIFFFEKCSGFFFGGGGGGVRAKNKFFSTTNFFFKNVPGVLKWFFGGGGVGEILGAPHAAPGSHAGSENDTLPLTMTHDRRQFWNDSPCRTKVIIWKPWRRKKKQILTKP